MPQEDFMGQYIPRRRAEDMEGDARFADGNRPAQAGEHMPFMHGKPHGFAVPAMAEETFLPSLMEDWVQNVADSMQMPSEPVVPPVPFSESGGVGHVVSPHAGAHPGMHAGPHVGAHTGGHTGGPVGGPASVHAGMSADGAYPTLHNTFQEMLRSLIGRYVVADFLIGTSMMEQRTGVISDVGPGYCILRDPRTETYTACDVSSLKFLSILPMTDTTEEALCPYPHFDHL